MKKWLLIGCIVVAAGYLAAAHLSGGAFFTFGLPLGGDRGELRRTAIKFLEDVQFKDFDKASSYHSPADRGDVDIPFLIQRVFAVKHEALDIMDYEVVFAEMDTSGLRARVKVRITAKELLRGELREQPLMLYFNREHDKAPWYMKFEDSLRDPEKDQHKKG